MNKKLLLFVFSFTILNLGYANLQTSIDSLKLEIEKNPDVYSLHFKLGLCYYSLEQFENALNEFTQVLSLKQDHKTAIMKLVLVYGHFGEYEKMMELCNATMQRFGKSDYYLSYECGIANAFLGNYDISIQFYNDALKLSPHEKFEYDKELQLAMIYQSLKDTAEATKWFNKSLKGISAFGKSYEAIWHFWFGRYDKAYGIQSKEKKEYVNIYNLGVYQIASGDMRGLETIKSACDKDTTGFVEAVYDAIISIKSDSLLEAESTLKQEISALKYSGMANGLLAWTLEKLGKKKEAKKCWFKCYGKLPLCINVESMRNFINKFLNTIK